jgi:hypothetical protein
MKRSMIVVTLTLVAAALLPPVSSALAAYTEGFEGTGYDFYQDPGSSAGVASAVAHSGLQSAQFTLDATHFAYTRWKTPDITSYGLTLNNVMASDWVMRTAGRSDLAPYLLFTIDTPDTSQETLAIQFLMPSIADNTWTLNTIDRNATTFHVTGDRTGLGATEFSASGTQGTLNDLAAKTYAGSTTWGDFNISHVRVGVGLWDAAAVWNGYADDVSLSVVPEPSTIALVSVGIFGGLILRRRQRKA